MVPYRFPGANSRHGSSCVRGRRSGGRCPTLERFVFGGAAASENAANALSDERPTRLTENLRICYPHLTAKSDQYGSRTTAETQLVQVKEGVKDPQIIGAFSGIFNLLEGFDTSMSEDKSSIPALKKYRRLRVAGILQEIEAVWSSYDDFVDFFTEEIGIAPTIFHLIDWKRAKPLTMPSKEIGDWHAGDPVLERDGYLVFPMRHCTELDAASMHERWVHGTRFSSLWNILGHGNAVASLGDAETLTGVWTSTKPVCLESFYSCLSHIGLGVTVRLALLLRPLGKNAHEAYKHTEKGPAHQRVIKQFRVRVEAIALKEETIGEGTSAVAGNLLSHNPATHLWNPVLEVNPHSAEA